MASAYLSARDRRRPLPGSHDPLINGEGELLRRLGRELAVVFDVGANVGDWSALVLEASPSAEVHAFEISPPTAERLHARYRDERRVKVNVCGLSDDDAEVQITHYDELPILTSTVSYPHHVTGRPIAAHVVRGDQYVADAGIEMIDLLKIDAEGAEQRVLAGFDRTIAAARVRAIQFEYGRVSILTHFLLHDVYELLGDDYAIGRITPAGVAFVDYDFALETFEDSNWFAVRHGSGDRLRALASEL
jgi:FkbM family methyltransferase